MHRSRFFSHDRSIVYSYTDKLITLILVVATFLVPPMMLGLKFTVISLPLLFGALAIFLSVRKVGKIVVSHKSLIFLTAVWCYYLYLCIQSVYFTNDVKIDYFKSIISITTFVIVFSIVFSNMAIRYYYFKAIICILVFFVISNLFTLILSFIVPAESLLLFELPLYQDAYKLQVFFPATVSYGRLVLFDNVIMRLSALFREPGIAQAFYIWAFIISPRYFNSKIIPVLLLLGVLMTLSTTGFIVLSIVLLFYTILQSFSVKKLISSTSLFLVAATIYIIVPGVNLDSKNVESYDARIGKLDEASLVFYSNPIFGTGASNAYIEGTSTSLLQQSYAIGGVGIMLFLSIFLVSFLFELRDWRIFIISISPLLITALVAQPIYDSSILYLFAFASHLYPNSNSNGNS